MPADRAETTLTWLLRVLGGLTLSAVVGVVLPTEWMASINDWLGLEPLQRSPLTEYLTRSLSAIYAVVGALTLFVSRDVRGYVDFIAFGALLTMALGVFFTILDLWAGMPSSWAWTEGPPTIVVGYWMRWLARRVSTQ